MAISVESILTGNNATYVAELYAKYLDNPRAVDLEWASFFEELQEDDKAILEDLKGASWSANDKGIVGRYDNKDSDQLAASSATDSAGMLARGLSERDDMARTRRATLDSIRALMMIRAYRVRGHLIAKFDPLGLEGQNHHPELDPKSYGFHDEDMNRPIFIDNVLGLETATPCEILQVLKDTYCSYIGVEFMHIMESEEKIWIQRRIESARNHTDFSQRGKRAILDRLIEAEGFENFLNVKYPGTKRFGLDGGESMIPAIEQILKRGSQLGIKEVVIGMPHRGRLNMLASVMAKPYVAIFSEFRGMSSNPDGVQGSGDVKYHLGTSSNRIFDSQAVHLSLTANPSHLEAVNPVVLGKVRAKQNQYGDEKRGSVMGLLLHGDAAFSGQGLVPESLDLSQLRGYRTGGTIHVIVNNQIGFTTVPSKSRSSPYPSDVAKCIQAPIFHVNGDDPEAVVHVARLATEFRQEFKRDVVIDMFCYRRHGHNEGDEPMFTQPIMYRAISKHLTTRRIYERQLISEGSMTQEEVDRTGADFQNHLSQEFDAASGYKPNKADWLEGSWSGLVQHSGEAELLEEETAVDTALLKEVGSSISRVPENFNIHPRLQRQIKIKRNMIESGTGIDWATGESLAFGTLMCEGFRVRLSGQDSVRGTFSHRHSALIDQETEEHYFPLSEIRRDQAKFEVMDSPLSEAGVLGFEYGYSLADPQTLVLWEAQFGDFANGAQVIIDQFICSGESKWLRMCSVVLLLPHGLEGQGPEHSSARLERFLQLSAEDNWQVCNITTPANYFHALRRQMHRNFRKPLVVMSPKSLLRHKLAISDLSEMGPGTSFRRVIREVDNLVADKKVRRVILCSGKVYYDLLEERRAKQINDVAIVRVEQLYPWPRRGLENQLTRYPNAEIIWCQEEPANMGSWTFVLPRLMNLFDELDHKNARRPLYVGRPAAASPATGFARKHNEEQARLVDEALTGKLTKIQQPFSRVRR